jgi:tetratricopeptide (TPR) repeat protein
LQKREWDKAIADYTEAIRLDPKDVLAYGSRGFAYSHKGDLDKAIADYTEAIHLDSKRASTYGNRGMAYAQKGDLGKAISDYSEAIRLDPKDASAYFVRGAAYSQKGEWDKAVVDAKKVIELQPNNPQGYNSVAWLLATCPKDAVRNGTEAVKYATKACKVTGWKEAFFFDTLAAAYAEAGQFDKAVEWQQKALADPNAFPPKEHKNCERRLELYKAGKPCHEE